MPNRRTLLTLLVAVSAAAASACAPFPAEAAGNLVDLQVVDRARNDLLPTYRARGANWVAGRPGDRYALRMTNRSGGRVLVVLSVDGVNVISGDTAAVGQTGYVLAPWQTAEITGWRKSASEAANFYFTALPDSYAARTDRPDNVGVIGAAVFREKVLQPAYRPWESQPPIANRLDGAPRSEPERRASQGAATGAAEANSTARAAPPPAASPSLEQPSMRDRDSLAKTEKLGTGHGEREYSPITHTSFERASSQPNEVVQVRYDSYANLVAAGVIGRPRMPVVPDPFPGYVPDPR